MEKSYDRPILIRLLSILLLLSAAILLVTQAAFFSRISNGADTTGISVILVQASLGFLELIGLSAGIGLWLGRKWGWWLALPFTAPKERILQATM